MKNTNRTKYYSFLYLILSIVLLPTFQESLFAQEFSVLGVSTSSLTQRYAKYSNSANYVAYYTDISGFTDPKTPCSLGVSKIEDNGAVGEVILLNNPCDAGARTYVLDVGDNGDVLFAIDKNLPVTDITYDFYYFIKSQQQLKKLITSKLDFNFNPRSLSLGQIVREKVSIVNNIEAIIKDDGTVQTTSLFEKFGKTGSYFISSLGTYLLVRSQECKVKKGGGSAGCQLVLEELQEDGKVLSSNILNQSRGTENVTLYNYIEAYINNFSKLIIEASGQKTSKFGDSYTHTYGYDTTEKSLTTISTNLSKGFNIAKGFGLTNFGLYKNLILNNFTDLNMVSTSGFACIVPKSAGFSFIGRIISVRNNGDIVLGSINRNYENNSDYYNANYESGKPREIDFAIFRPDYNKPAVNYCAQNKEIKVFTEGACQYKDQRKAERFSKVNSTNTCQIKVVVNSDAVRSLITDKRDLNLTSVITRTYKYNRGSGTWETKVISEKDTLLKYNNGKWIAKLKVPLKRFGNRRLNYKLSFSMFRGEAQLHEVFGVPYEAIGLRFRR